MKILVTGANGFSARYLIRQLREEGCGDVYLTDITPAAEADFFPCDLAGEEAASALVERILPDQIYHLAGTFTNDYATDYAANVLSSRNLLESVRKYRPACRVLLVGSSAEYGLVPCEDNPVDEEHALTPVSIYGLTKVYQTYLGRFYVKVHKLNVMIARPFNLLGRGLSSQLFVGRVYEQMDAYRSGKLTRISVGNLESRRDYIAVGEAVRAYRLIVEKGVAGEVYNVGSGSSIQVRDLLHAILKENGLGIEVVEERKVVADNKLDVSELFADITKLRSLNGG